MPMPILGIVIPLPSSCAQGSVQSTEYRWSFNDSTANVVKIGLASNQGLVHAFSSPGLYTVTVTASNSGGTSDTKQIITVYGDSHTKNMVQLVFLDLSTLFASFEITDKCC